MAVRRSIWFTMFTRDAFPGLPCPHCEPGKLKVVKSSIEIVEPEYSKKLHSHPDYDFEWSTQRFSAKMKCDEDKCGEFVFIIGDTDYAQVEAGDEEDHGWAYEEILCLKSAFPPPPLFHIPSKVPQPIQKQLKLAFQFFWGDIPSAIGRLRTAIELMLDQQKVPKEKISKKNKSVRLDLAERIEIFAAATTDDSAKEALHGLRYIGNLGTHGGEVTLEAFFDAVDVLEDVLLGVYEKQSIKAKVKKLVDKKGKY